MNQQFLMAVVLLLVGVVVLPMQVVMPLWGDIQEKQGVIGEKKSSIETLTQSIQSLQAQVARLQEVKALPEGVQIRTVAEADVNATVKDLLDDVVLLAGHLGNDLVSLEPAKAGKKQTKMPEGDGAKPLTAKEKRAARAKAEAGNVTEEGADANANKPKRVEAKSYDYTVTIRGTYAAIQGLLNALANHPDLIEVKLLELTNEGGNDREQILLGNLKVNKPMRATLQLSLWLMPPTPPMSPQPVSLSAAAAGASQAPLAAKSSGASAVVPMD